MTLLVTGTVLAAGPIIDGRTAPYSTLSNVQGTSIYDSVEIRIAGMSQAASTYRLAHGLSTLPAGSTFEMVWPGGTQETAGVTSPFSSVGAGPLSPSAGRQIRFVDRKLRIDNAKGRLARPFLCRTQLRVRGAGSSPFSTYVVVRSRASAAL